MNQQTLKSRNYEGWNTNSHLRTFEFWNALSNRSFNFMYGSFQENKYLIELIKKRKAKSVVDIGCATGTTYKLLRNFVGERNFEYNGFDISEPAIAQARKLHKKNIFHLSNHNDYRKLSEQKRDIIFSRDTLMHQEKPFEFLSELIKFATKYLVLRVRTRDNGETEWDVGKSTQMHYDKYWMPYIVINSEELINFIISQKKPKAITINRSYETLGGHNFRYLPKDLYYEAARGSETSLCIEYSDINEVQTETQILYTENIEGQKFLRKNRIKVMLSRALDKAFYFTKNK